MASVVKGEKGSSEQVLDLYAGLLLEIWEIVSELIGEAILALLFSLAVKNIKEKYPFLDALRVSEDGLSLEGVKKSGRNIVPGEVHRAFQGLITHLLDLFSALAEGVISRELLPKVFPKVREAERIVTPK
jgi:hypothetical protein